MKQPRSQRSWTLANGVLRFRRLRRGNQDGQALIELGIILVVFITLLMGMIEFGRAWMVANMITHAARDGARAAAVAPTTRRDANGFLVDTGGIETQVKTQIANVVGAAHAGSFNVQVTQPFSGGIPMVNVQINGSVPYIFNLVGTNFTVARSVSFRDEGR